MTIPGNTVSIAQLLRQVCQLMSIDASLVLEAARLSEKDCQSAAEPRHYFDLYEGVRQVHRQLHGDIGFETALARAYARGPYLAPILACAAAPDLKTGLERLARYKPLVAPVTMDMRCEGDVVELAVMSQFTDLKLPQSMALFEMLFVIEKAQIFTGRTIDPICLTLPDVAAAQAVLDISGLSYRCKHGEPSLRLARADMDLALLSANPVLWATLEPTLEAELRTKVGRGIITERLAAELARALPDGAITADDLACRMGLSKRSLQRKLQSEGTTFQEVLNETRANLAQSYLSGSGMSVAEISHQLGFRSVSSFFRNFQSWMGMTPRAFRESRQVE